jgi:hypothetical protein
MKDWTPGAYSPRTRLLYPPHNHLCMDYRGVEFRDRDWIYGDDPASFFQSIAQGRPNGMPAFGFKLPDEQIWKIALYVQSLGEQAAERGGAQGGPTEATRRRQPAGARGQR